MQTATEKEYNEVVSRRGMQKRVMQTKRTFDVIWSDRGTEVASKSEIMSRGKVQSTTYSVDPKYLGRTAGRLDGARKHQLMPQEIRRKLPDLYSQDGVEDPIVRVKFFSPYKNMVWLVTEFDGQDTMFGWADLGMGGAELGYISLRELDNLHRSGLPLVERDLYFTPKKLSQAKVQERRGSEENGLRTKLVRLAYNNPELRPDLLPLLKTAARAGDATWRKMLTDLHRGVAGEWSFDGRALDELRVWLEENGGKPLQASSHFSKGRQINYNITRPGISVSIEAHEGNFLGPFTQVHARKGTWRGTPYLGD
jgi:hypothetical protein